MDANRRIEALEREVTLLRRQLARVPVVVGGGGAGGGAGGAYVTFAETEADLPNPPPDGVLFGIVYKGDPAVSGDEPCLYGWVREVGAEDADSARQQFWDEEGTWVRLTLTKIVMGS